MMLLAALTSCAFQDPLAAVAESEARRVAVIDRCSHAVCSVMSMDSPGGGSGVIIDPAGFLLTNFHVVGKPDKDYKLPEPPERIRIATEADAVIRSLGKPPLAGQERIAEHYFSAVADRAVMLASALAAAGGLVEAEELVE